MKEDAVSSVLGEVLMIALVLVLVPVVTISLMHQLPEDRTPVVTIQAWSPDASSVWLFHKGGDWVRVQDMRILVNGNQDWSWQAGYQNQTFDLGDRITVSGVHTGDTIGVVVKNSVVFSGTLHAY